MVQYGRSESERQFLATTHGRWPRVLSPRRFPETRTSLLETLRGDQPGQSAWREFFECYAPAVYRVARRQGLGAHDADDIVQQVMLAISAHIGDFNYDRDRGRFRQWVKSITANKIRDLFRRRGHREVAFVAARDGVAAGPSVDESWEQEWHVQDMLRCLDQVRADVAPRQYKAFELYVLEGLSAEETAKRVGMTRAYVYVMRTQIIKRIRALMRRFEDEGGAT